MVKVGFGLSKGKESNNNRLRRGRTGDKPGRALQDTASILPGKKERHTPARSAKDRPGSLRPDKPGGGGRHPAPKWDDLWRFGLVSPHWRPDRPVSQPFCDKDLCPPTAA